MDFWRISRYPDLTGMGGLIASARWHTAPRPVVYLAACSPGALVETLVHLQRGDFPDMLRLFTVQSITHVETTTLSPAAIAEFWQEKHTITRGLGDAWLDARSTALARIPSAIVPHGWNYLLNPAHSEARLFRIAGGGGISARWSLILTPARGSPSPPRNPSRSAR